MDFNKSTDLPSSVDTAEKLVVWSASLLIETLPEEEVKLQGSSNPRKRLDYAIIPDYENVPLLAVTLYIELPEDFASSGNKLWELFKILKLIIYYN